MIYADHAATTQLDMEAYQAMQPYLLGEYGNASQPYSFARSAKNALRTARAEIADCIHALPEEIYFTSGGTESDNWAVKGTVSHNGHRTEIVTSSIEHHAVLRTCEALKRIGVPVSVLNADGQGVVQPQALSTALSRQTRLVSVMFANNEVGTVQPIGTLCEIAHAHGALFHTDAVQAVGHLPVDARSLGVDLLSASAHKFYGPKGIGFLYIRKGTEIEPLLNGGAQEFGLRSGTENIASIVGMATALRKSCAAMQEETARLYAIEQAFLSALQSEGLDFIRNGHPAHIPGNVSVSFRGAMGETLLHRLDLMGIIVSTGSACDSKNTRISHVLKAMKVPEFYALGTIRVSFGRENNVEDAEIIAKAIGKIIRSMSN